jgi:site-specific DNA-cytosine methylase
VDLYSGIGNSACVSIASVLLWCESDPALRALLQQRFPLAVVHDDVNTISTLKMPLHGLLKASPPCQPWSQANKGPSGCQGPKDPRTDSLKWIYYLLTRDRPMGFIGEQVEGMFHWESRGSFTVNTPGPAFRDLVTRIRRAGYRVQVDTISTSRVPQQLDAPPLPQFRERVIIVATRHDVAALMGPLHVAAFHAKHRSVADLLRAQALHPLSRVVVSASDIVPLPKPSVFLDHKPHKLDTWKSHDVWAASGLSPCVRTGNRIFFSLDGDLVELELAGYAAVQGLSMGDLPADRILARHAVGNSFPTSVPIAVGVPFTQYLLDAARLHNCPLQSPSQARVPWPEQFKAPSALDAARIMSSDYELESFFTAPALRTRSHLPPTATVVAAASVAPKALPAAAAAPPTNTVGYTSIDVLPCSRPPSVQNSAYRAPVSTPQSAATVPH